MHHPNDVIIIGTGVAALIAANHLHNEGRKPILLNPDWDFFREDSELPFDPLWPILEDRVTVDRIRRNAPEKGLETLRPDYPGAIEFWNTEQKGGMQSREYHDPRAPHVRSRARLWISGDALPGISALQAAERWEVLESLFVQSSDAGLNPQELEGVLAAKRFPGFSKKNVGDLKGLFLPKLYDVDVQRYRDGLLEYVRERLGPDQVICQVPQIERTNEGVRVYWNGSWKNFTTEGVLVFWTPRLTSWIFSQNFNRQKLQPFFPVGVRLWEEWSLASREGLDPRCIGVFEDLMIWANYDGIAQEDRNYDLNILRPGPLLPVFDHAPADLSTEWASGESFGSIYRLCHDFMGWDKVSVRAFRLRTLFEWEQTQDIYNEGSVTIIPQADGALVDVVEKARQAAAKFL